LSILAASPWRLSLACAILLIFNTFKA
jgi:hypothetical protein